MHPTGLVPAWLFILLFGSVVATDASRWTFGGRGGVVQHGGELRAQVALTAEYAFHRQLSWRTDLEALFPDLTIAEEFELSVPTHLLWYPIGKDAKFSPYLGPGLSVTLPLAGGFLLGSMFTGGASLDVGQGRRIGLEARWRWPDLTDPGSSRREMSLTGDWSFQF